MIGFLAQLLLFEKERRLRTNLFEPMQDRRRARDGFSIDHEDRGLRGPAECLGLSRMEAGEQVVPIGIESLPIERSAYLFIEMRERELIENEVRVGSSR